MAKRTITLEDGAQVHISQESYDELAKTVQNKRWKPENDDYFYYLTDNGEIEHLNWLDFIKGNQYRYSQRNVFRTREEAEQHLKYLKALAVVRDDAEDFEPDYRELKSLRYSVYYNTVTKDIHTMEHGYDIDPCNIYFETKEKAQHSIDVHRDEWLTVFGVER